MSLKCVFLQNVAEADLQLTEAWVLVESLCVHMYSL